MSEYAGMTSSIFSSLPPNIEVGDSNIANDFLAPYRPTTSTFLGLVSPKNESQIKEVIDWANETKVGVIPKSSKGRPRKNLFEITSDKNIILNLTQMDQVLHIDSRDAIAIIEPGVTFTQLDQELKPYGLRSMKPLLPDTEKSVLATFLDREPSISPNEHWDSTDPLAALNIIFGNGERFRTGGASAPGSLKENLDRGLRQMMSSGPVTTDYSRVLLGSQGTLGISCWGSIYCERIPTIEEDSLFSSKTLEPLLNMANQLSLKQIGLHYFIVDHEQLLVMLANNIEEYKSLSDSKARRTESQHWYLYVNLAVNDYRAKQAIDWQFATLKGIAKASCVEAVTYDQFPEIHNLREQLQKPPRVYYKDRLKKPYINIFCLTQASNTSSIVSKFQQALEEFKYENSIDLVASVYIQPVIQASSCHVEFTLFYNSGDKDRIRSFEQKLIDVLATNGGFFSRPYGSWNSVAFEQNPQIVKHLKKTKEIFDPAGILSPGRLCF